MVDDKGNVYCDTITELRGLFGGLVNGIAGQKFKVAPFVISLFNILDGKYVDYVNFIVQSNKPMFCGNLLEMKFEFENQFNTPLMECR